MAAGLAVVCKVLPVFHRRQQNIHFVGMEIQIELLFVLVQQTAAVDQVATASAAAVLPFIIVIQLELQLLTEYVLYLVAVATPNVFGIIVIIVYMQRVYHTDLLLSLVIPPSYVPERIFILHALQVRVGESVGLTVSIVLKEE